MKIADLVTEDGRDKVQNYLRNMNSADDLDIIIALGMAKEGFDWPWAECALTIGYRGSLTEIVQIIGRVTRDSNNKTHAQFTNLIAQPDAEDDNVKVAVNTILKAITASLLMEQVLAPELKINSKSGNDIDSTSTNSNTMHVKELKEPSTPRTRDIIENDLPDLKAAILQDTKVQEAIASKASANTINKVLLPKVIMEQKPDLTDKELEEVCQYTIAEMNLKQAKIQDIPSESGENKSFLRLADKLINVDDLDINLIEKINPFQRAYEVISNNIDSKTLRLIQQTIDSKKLDFSESELVILYKQIKNFIKDNKKYPDKNSKDEMEVKYAYALAKIKDLKMRRDAEHGR